MILVKTLSEFDFAYKLKTDFEPTFKRNCNFIVKPHLRKKTIKRRGASKENKKDGYQTSISDFMEII